MEEFHSTRYGPEVAGVLALDGNGRRPMPLTCGGCLCPEAHALLKTLKPRKVFPGAANPEAPMAGLWLYFSSFEEAHDLVNDSEEPECELWHAILHRQEPDSGNAAYWFRKAGSHPAFPRIAEAATKILERLSEAEFRIGRWDPFAFIAFCERAREQPGSVQEQAALEIQLAEWQILFDHSAGTP
jgi:hypothetical protein